MRGFAGLVIWDAKDPAEEPGEDRIVVGLRQALVLSYPTVLY